MSEFEAIVYIVMALVFGYFIGYAKGQAQL